eukprot:SAG22_NODE_9546_length_583_cov_20.797521_2_plen_111_part_01
MKTQRCLQQSPQHSSDSSLKQYLSSLRTLNDKKPIQDIDFLKDSGANPQMFFVLNEYKTRKKYGEKKVDIKDPEIITGLKVWLKHRPTQTDSLFYDSGRDFSVPANSASIT